MDEFKLKLLLLTTIPGIGWKTICKMLKDDPELKNVSCSSLKELSSPIVKSPQTVNFKDTHHPEFIYEQIRQYSLNGIKTITIFDKEYPALLKETYQPPWVIYAKGDLSLLQNKELLAVVGSRQHSDYGENAINYLFPPLIERGIVIVSGLAAGIDTAAHHAAIKCGGKTIGVIAGGFYHIYPHTNKNLAYEMMKNHLLLSEYPPDTKPSRWQFPMRNRIISGISKGTLIVQAKKKSGSLITANFAVQEGREVFALPGNIFSPYSAGTNELIQQGAKLVSTPEDILEEFIY
jgi:DNA processing protein